MKKKYSLLLGLAIMASSGFTSVNAQTFAKKVDGFTIEGCNEAYETVNFCNDYSIAQYRKALRTKKVNFNNKYILHFFTPNKHGNREVVAINPTNKRVIILGVEINPTSKVNFSKSSDTFCFSGSIEGYRQSNEGNHICYRLQKDKYSEFGIDFMNISYNH